MLRFGFQKADVFVIKPNEAIGAVAFKRLGCRATKNHIGVCGLVAKLRANTIHDAVAGGEQHNEDEDAPRDGESREERPQLIAAQSHEYFAPEVHKLFF